MTKPKLKRLRNLHNLVIHKRSGTDQEYYLESRELAKYNDEVLLMICHKCFKTAR